MILGNSERPCIHCGQEPRTEGSEFCAHCRWTSPDPLCHVCGKQFCEHRSNVPKIPPPMVKPVDPAAWEATRKYLMDLVEQAQHERDNMPGEVLNDTDC